MRPIAHSLRDCGPSMATTCSLTRRAVSAPPRRRRRRRQARGENEGVFGECHGRHVGAVATTWADQNAPSPGREIAFYNEVVNCVEEQTGEDYGEVEARSDTRATDAAIADAPGVYDACFDDVLNRYPGFSSSS